MSPKEKSESSEIGALVNCSDRPLFVCILSVLPTPNLLYPSRCRGLRVIGIAELVTEKIEREQRTCENAARKNNQPPVTDVQVHGVDPISGKVSQRGSGLLDSDSQEAQERFLQNCLRHYERRVYDDGPDEVWEEVLS